MPFDEYGKRAVAQATTAMAQDAMRVIAVAYLERPGHTGELREEDITDKLIFVGLLGMTDPPRQDAKEAVKLCHSAGIKVVMITGDNEVTAESVSRELGLRHGKTINGNGLRQMSDEALTRQIEGTSIFARIEPLHKLRIVGAFKSRGHTVAMTGDGVNDAPALKAADIGIAMGITGTDVAKEASDMVLADDNFASIVAAVEEGRAIFERLRNVVFFMLSTGLGELLALTLSVIFMGIAPLLPLQIIWINLVTGTMMSVPLALEPKTGDELRMPPRDPRVGLLYPGLIIRTTIMAILLGVSVFLVFNRILPSASPEEARTTAFCAVVIFEWLVALSARSDEKTVSQLGMLRNRWLLIAITVAIALQLMVVYAPILQPIFKTVPISPDRWAMAILPGVIAFGAETIRKRLAPWLFSSGKWHPNKSPHLPS